MVSNTNNVIDSRDIIERIEELEDQFQYDYDAEKDRIEEEHDTEKEEFEEEYEGLKEIALEENDEDFPNDFEEWLEDQNFKSLEDRISEDLGEYEDWIKDQDDYSEYESLINLRDEADGCPDWIYGATLIKWDYFTEYCKELCEDIGDVPREIPSYIVIDWEATAENLMDDYIEVDFDGETYYIRSC